MQERVESKEGKKMIGRRMSTVEPVFGSLLNYYGMKRVNAKGKEAAHKFMLMAACAYNLQKLLIHIPHPKNKVQVLPTQQLLVFYFTFLCVVQQPRAVMLTIHYFLCVFDLIISKKLFKLKREKAKKFKFVVCKNNTVAI